MKYLVVILLLAALIAECEMRSRRGKLILTRRNKIGLTDRSLPDAGLDISDELQTAHLTGRDVDEINEDGLDSEQTALLQNDLQWLLQRVLIKREEAEDGTDDI